MKTVCSLSLKPLLRAGLSIGLFCLVGTAITTYTHLGECASDSMKSFKYALFFKTSSFNRGDIVLIRRHLPKYKGRNQLSEIAYAKRIVGMSGDLLHRDKERLCISSQAQNDKPLALNPVCFSHNQAVNNLSNGQSLPLLGQTKDGNLLTPLKADVVPEGYVFVAGDHLRSFDSRYEEFGLVPQQNLWGKAAATW